MGDFESSERRSFNINLENRITTLEVESKFMVNELKETRSELSQFRHDLFELLNPMKDTVSYNSTDITWIKSWLWKTVALNTVTDTIISGFISKFFK